MNAKMVAITCSEMEAASGTTQRELDEMKQEILKARCVATATDDPRLQEKERTRNPSQPALRRKRRTLPVFIIAGVMRIHRSHALSENPSYFAAMGGGGRSMTGLWLKNPRRRR
jgi:hypothetical protein